ncbi:MAG: Alanine racemase [Acidimicrobiaceae bacterium]|nr:Alanine racemase [Acidimicrobiaceae bacterium]
MGETSLCAVVKADAYSHGALTVARAALAAGADSLAVVTVDEGMELRCGGIDRPILLLAEVSRPEIAEALASDLTLSVGSLEGARAVITSAQQFGGVHRVHVKVDTGMHRMGVEPASLDQVLDTLRASSSIDVEGLFTHFAVAEGTSAADRAFTRLQIDRFDDIVDRLTYRGVVPRVLHLSNSAGALGYPSARRSMVRIGLALYGYLPESWLGGALEEKGQHLEPVLTLRSRVSAVRRVAAGERPSYGRRRVLESDATVVTVPIGYADGYPRAMLAGGAEVLIRGKRYPLAGHVTMDQLVVDAGDDEVALGDDVVLLGRDGDEVISADEWARWANSVSWEVLSRIGPRVSRVVVD